MNIQNLEITVNPRGSGKHESRQLRLKKRIPAVVYGPKLQNTTVELYQGDAVKFSKHGYENAIFTLKSSEKGIDGVKALIKKVEVHPVSRLPLHLDFYALDMTKEIRVNVELRFEGKPAGAAEGGLLSVVTREVEVECLPTEIPEFFAVDVSGLGLNESLHVSDLKVSDRIKIVSSSDMTLATVSIVTEQEAAPQPAAATAAAAPGAAAPAAAAGGDAKKAEGKKD